MASRGLGKVGCGRSGVAGRGMACSVRLRAAGEARRVKAGFGDAPRGWARRGKVRCGAAGGVAHGCARQGKVRRGKAGAVRTGEDSRGQVCNRMVRSGAAGLG
jgi:hypothetical protein